MSANREPNPIDAETAERLLGGERIAGQERLVGLLNAISSPACSTELTGEAEALAAFRKARDNPVPSDSKPCSQRAAISNFLTAKLLAVALALGGISGIALAAGTSSVVDQSEGTQPDAEKPYASAQALASTPEESSARSGGESVLEMCEIYLRQDDQQRGSTLEEGSQFENLAVAAGSEDKDRVDQFCVSLRQRPTQQDAPTGDPNEALGGEPSAPESRAPTPAETDSDQHWDSSASGPPGGGQPDGPTVAADAD